jgi:uncharacterized phage infection (PIP) family protein YhgE
MAFSESIKLTIDLVASNAQSGLRRLKSDLSDADGAFDKTKAASSSLWDGIKQHAGAAALGAGAAIGAFALKAIDSFQDTALGAGKLRDSLGLTAEEASRFQEVAGDLGIGVDALSSAMGKMNVAAARTPEAFDAIGASLKRNADGSINVQETFLSTVDALNKIPDASARADAAQKIFGKGWKDISELVASGADGVREALASVEDQKIINDDEIEKARKFRDTMDEWKGKLESATLAVGQFLVSVTGYMEGLGDTIQQTEDILDRFVGRVGRGFANIGDALNPFNDDTKEIKVNVDRMVSSMDDAAPTVRDLTTGFQGLDFAAQGAVTGFKGVDEGFEDMESSADDLSTGFAGLDYSFKAATSGAEGLTEAQELAADQAKILKDRIAAQTEALKKNTEAAIAAAGGAFSLERAQLQLEQSVSDLEVQQLETTAAIQDGTVKGREAESALRDVRSAEIGAAEEAFNLAEDFAKSAGAAEGSAEKASLMRSKLQELQNKFPALRNEIQTYIDKLNAIPTSRTTTVRVIGVGATGGSVGGGAVPQATGGAVIAGQSYVVGDGGREELFVPNENGNILPHVPNGWGDGGGAAVAVGSSVVVNVTAPLGQNPADFGRTIVAAIKSYEAIAGNAWRNR